MTKYFICGAYNPIDGRISTLWLVTTVPNDKFQSGQKVTVNGREYLLGQRDLSRGEVASYELILREEVLEL